MREITFPENFRSVIFTRPEDFSPYQDADDGGYLAFLDFGPDYEVRADAYYIGQICTFMTGVVAEQNQKDDTAPVPLASAQYSKPLEYVLMDINFDETAWTFQRLDSSATFAPYRWTFATKSSAVNPSPFLTVGVTPAASIISIRNEQGGIEFAGGNLIPPELEPPATAFSFAEGSTTPQWPVITRHRSRLFVSYRPAAGMQGSPARQFMASRGTDRFHAGVDLYGLHKDIVVAMEPGVIVNRYHFFHGTWCLVQQCDSGLVILYGEIEKDSWRKFGISVGTRVQRGDRIARVGRMGGGSHMLHIETYRPGTTTNKRINRPGQPNDILDPTRYLVLAARTQERQAPPVS